MLHFFVCPERERESELAQDLSHRGLHSSRLQRIEKRRRTSISPNFFFFCSIFLHGCSNCRFFEHPKTFSIVRRKAFSLDCREEEKDLDFTRLCEKRKRTKRSSLHCGKGKKGRKEGRSEGGK
jgi:hypothetical protein